LPSAPGPLAAPAAARAEVRLFKTYIAISTRATGSSSGSKGRSKAIDHGHCCIPQAEQTPEVQKSVTKDCYGRL